VAVVWHAPTASALNLFCRAIPRYIRPEFRFQLGGDYWTTFLCGEHTMRKDAVVSVGMRCALYNANSAALKCRGSSVVP